MRQARIEAFFYFLPALSHGAAGILRGAGKAFVPMLVLLASWCVVRVLFIRVMLLLFNDINVIYTAYPVTWLVSSAVFLVFLLSGKYLQLKRIRHD